MTFKRWHILFVFYLLLLAFSWFMQRYFSEENMPFAGEEETVIMHNERFLTIRYIRYTTKEHTAEIVIIPDNFFGPEHVIPFAKAMHREYGANITIPIFPVKDQDKNRVSHSVESRADYTRSLLEQISVDQVDVIGHGYGGLLAINLASDSSLDTNSVRSLSLLSSLGVVELQFLGNHLFNRTLYSLLHPVSLIYKWVVPHMGFYDLQLLQTSYITSLRQKDQRVVRDQLAKIEVPVLILHPLNDKMVPLSVAEENHRLLPHSYLVTHEADDQAIFHDPEIWLVHLTWFLGGVESHELALRENAHILRIERSANEFDAAAMRSIGGSTVVILIFLLALFTLISEDIACISGGLIVASRILPFHYAVLGCFIGILFTNMLVYMIGRTAGAPILNKRPVKWLIKPKDVKKAEKMFSMRGMEIIFVARFLPGTRLPVYLVAGILKQKFLNFIGYFLLSVVVWIPLMVGIAALAGKPILRYIDLYQNYAVWILLFIIILIYLFITFLIPLTTVTGRRKFIVRWARFSERYFGTTFERNT